MRYAKRTSVEIPSSASGSESDTSTEGEDSAVGEASVGEEDDQTSPPNGGCQVSSRRLRQ
ncbi:hypothetical protein PI124_g22262 [Phytophthora idaei]|nr:hypothetical protein PI125_g24015 [Phytophthora idaei]KAG3126946.1 hypothetical protein PI126_g22097 [Phytophthora idaei]KAG3232657.1 hypothetical protein PI124_g22262 [Phytophthora idaei]